MSLEGYIGQSFYWLEVIEPLSAAKAENRKQQLICVCRCGNFTLVRKAELIAGTTRSCGCYKGSEEWYRERFNEKVDKTGNCWIWTGYVSRHGYGRVSAKSNRTASGYSMRLAHRVSYEMAHGPIDKGLVVRHMCHNKLCVNPQHLKVGTAQDNMDDMVAAGRQNKGADRPNSKLDENDVRKIRFLYKNGWNQYELANRFNVSQCHVHNLVSRKAWAHVK